MVHKNKICSCDEMSRECGSPSLARDLFVEFLGTFFLVSVQLLVTIPLGGNTDGRGPVGVGLAMGFVVLFLVEALGNMGGGHFNPAVTIGLLVSNKITFLRGLLYIPLQVVGGITGAALVFGVTPDAERGMLGGTSVHPALEWWQGLIVEAWMTAMLMFAVLGSTNASRKTVMLPGIPIGLVIGLDLITGFYYTGSSMNPARSLAPAVFMGGKHPMLWDHQYIYWAGPAIGAVLASIIYTYVLDHVDKHED